MPPAAPETDAQPLPRCPAPGVTPVAGGADVAVHAPDASSVWLTTQDALGREHRHRLPRRREGWWFGRVPGLAVGTRYGLRADGPWAPERGHRFNPAKLLLDPYARAIDGDVRLTPAVYGHVVDDAGRGDHRVRSDLDSAPDTPRAVVVDLHADDLRVEEPGDAPPRHPADELVIYEAHVVELTRRLPAVPEELRGTYAGMGQPEIVDYIKGVEQLTITTTRNIVQTGNGTFDVMTRGTTVNSTSRTGRASSSATMRQASFTASHASRVRAVRTMRALVRPCSRQLRTLEGFSGARSRKSMAVSGSGWSSSGRLRTRSWDSSSWPSPGSSS